MKREIIIGFVTFLIWLIGFGLLCLMKAFAPWIGVAIVAFWFGYQVPGIYKYLKG
jgi:hypothetical protein